MVTTKARPTKKVAAKAAPTKKVAAKAAPAKKVTAEAAPAKKPVAAAKEPRVSTHPLKARTPAIVSVIRKVSALCLALPDTTELVAWGEPTWRVGGKLFAMFDTHHHGSPHLSVWIPAAPGAQAALIDADPDRFWRPPYVGHKGWVAIIVDDAAPPWDMIGSLIAQAHALIARPPARRR
jgi:hypothetical protein